MIGVNDGVDLCLSACLEYLVHPGTGLVYEGCSRLGLFGVSGCLLYTSPSPRDQRGSRMPSSA